MSKPVLLLDAGNSRLKWALASQDGWLCEGVAEYDTLEPFAVTLLSHPPASMALACNVAGPHTAQLVQELLSPLHIDWLRPSARQADLSNGYRDPAQLGADRWAALIGAHARSPGDTVVVVAGTAMTVDALTEEGEFLGGVIVPGFNLMRQALAKGTADLGLPEGEVSDFPRATGEAIVNGALLALVGAIEQMRMRLFARQRRPVRVLLSGGDAPRLAPLLAPMLAQALLTVDNLVLHGLHRLAFSPSDRKNTQ
ncbi:type III pantothenate kinase [Chitinimonas sp.]|uniref:type III pantothenate kinase n=1 Tax=Chitinimonas sp. TaxID=1934313 RepID=UPI0035AD9393